jgi:hypothetical protein
MYNIKLTELMFRGPLVILLTEHQFHSACKLRVLRLDDQQKFY